ncbi:MAG: HvfB family MNIO-type RiPP peptide maturase [Cytophaga sp.]|uniref:HvfB family MNIO-type RiPP peptide maturase n=1 Tax=Cytophaga sp. TaxID=29535 RepID=UPI003F7F78D2
MVGIGFRKDFASDFLNSTVLQPDFIEVAPENWIGIGGFWKKKLLQALEKYPLYTHGLSLSIGSPEPLDFELLKSIKKFLSESGARVYSEHLSYSQYDNAHMYDLLPIPFTQDAVMHIAERINTVQDFLERKIALEIVSYYSPVAAEMSEIEFIKNILMEADCDLLLDVNNIYVNGFNHKYDPYAFIDQLPLEKVSYIHMAGHDQVSDTLIIDTHGEAIVDPVYDLFEYTMHALKRDIPVLLERDFNIPELMELQAEIDRLKKIKSDSLYKERYGILR